MRGEQARPIVIAAGGTGGHFFPAEALAAELIRRGHRVVLMTDARSGAARSAVFAGREIAVLPGAGIAGRGLRRGVAAAAALVRGTLEARRRLTLLGPALIVGFGGYPSVPPVLGARLLKRRPPVVLHEQNAILGRANRLLSRWADQVALGLAPAGTYGVLRGRLETRSGESEAPRDPSSGSRPAVVSEHRSGADIESVSTGAQETAVGWPPERVSRRSLTGNPVRPDIAALAGQPYVKPEPGGPLHLLVTGGSQGARVFADALPQAIGLLNENLRSRLRIVQQCRPEDLERVRAAYAAMAVAAELSSFFADMPDRLRWAHLVVARAGASTVAELAVAGRPALLVPFPHAIDDHQAHNAAAISSPMLEQATFERDPKVLAEALAARLNHPDLLDAEAHAMAEHGIPDAAIRLADLVEAQLEAAPKQEIMA